MRSAQTPSGPRPRVCTWDDRSSEFEGAVGYEGAEVSGRAAKRKDRIEVSASTVMD